MTRSRPAQDETDRPWYDTKKGIAESLESLEKFTGLIEERCSAGYEREESLNRFYVLGNYCLDGCGNCLKATGISPKKMLPEIPDALTETEFWAYVQEQIGGNVCFSFAMGGNPPPPNLKCAHCGTPWRIDNCHDIVEWHTWKVIPLDNFVGDTLRNVRKAYRASNDAIYRMNPYRLVRNDRNIDLSLKYPDSELDWKRSIVKNEQGWLGEKDGMTGDYFITAGDEGLFEVWTCFHGVCNRAHLSQRQERLFREVFEKAGFKDIRMTSLPNEYCQCERCAPWFNVNTEFGTVKIGWRKRVIDIDWSAAVATLKASDQLPAQSISSLFKNEKVTKGETCIHAWGYEKAQDYLTKIYALLSGK